MNDTIAIILVVILFIFYGDSVLSLAENNKLEKEAVRRGYATYDQMGEFMWKEKIE